MEPDGLSRSLGTPPADTSTVGNGEHLKLDMANHATSTAASGISNLTTEKSPAPRSRVASGSTLVDNTDHLMNSMNSIACNLESISLNTDNKPDHSLICTAPDCPLKNTMHNKGLFLHEATLGFGVRFHNDFGYSNPPPFIWAAYFRYTQNVKELKDYCRSNGSVEIYCNSPLDHPWPNDATILLSFLRHHAVTLRYGEQSLTEVPLRGKILSSEEPTMVADMDALTL
ncbi:MAG: hypothetical protein Q9186_003381 [Xanthomendoza sp. 1 TL-2023]